MDEIDFYRYDYSAYTQLQVMIYSLKTYVMNKNIANTKDITNMSINTCFKTLSKYEENLVARKLRYGDVYEQNDQKKSFIKKLRRSLT